MTLFMNINIFCDHLGMTWGQVNDDRTVALYFYVNNCTIWPYQRTVIVLLKNADVKTGLWGLVGHYSCSRKNRRPVFGKRLSVSSLQEVKLPVYYSQMRYRSHARKKSKNCLSFYQWKIRDLVIYFPGLVMGSGFPQWSWDQMSVGRKFLPSSDGLNSFICFLKMVL